MRWLGGASERPEAEFTAHVARLHREKGELAAARFARRHSWGLQLEDGAAARVICARDQFGVQPLYYCHQPGRYFAFSSEVEPLLQLPGMERRLNRLKAVLYLSSLAWDAFDTEMTFFEGIHRLSPGHLLVATAQRVTVQRYATFEADQRWAEMTEDEGAEELRARLQRVLRRQRERAGLLLSGGLKSAALAALAGADLAPGERLPCWSFVPTDAPGWNWPDDPRPALAELAASAPLEMHPVAWNGWGERDEDDSYTEVRQQPIWFHIREEEMTAMAAARAAGMRALMSGVGAAWLPIFRRPVGVTLSALRGGNWREILRDQTQGRRRTFRELARLMKYDVVPPLLSGRGLGSRTAWIGRPTPAMEHRCLVRETIQRETGVREWVEERARRLQRDFRENAYHELVRGALQQRLESWALQGAQHGLEMRYPFLEPEVAEFCLGLPAAYYLQGDPQRVLRRALRGLVPETIRRRGGRMASITDWPLRKARKHPRERERLRQLERNTLLNEFVDLAPMHAALDRFPSESQLQGALAEGGLVAAARLVTPDGVPTTTEYFRGFARFLERNGFR